MENINRESPIAVIDSGMGGISVLKVMRQVMPNENYIYFGDSANAPYGEKSGDEVRDITDKNIEMLILRGAKAVVIACNTATSAAAEYVRSKYRDIPIIGMEPAVKPAAMSGEHPTVVVMATPLTLKREKFLHLTEQYKGEADFINVPCHGLVELVEEGVIDGPRMDKCLSDILLPYVEGKKINAVVLGCTHYIHASEAISRAFGGNVQIFDGALGTANETRRRLSCLDLLSDSNSVGSVEFLNSSNDKALLSLSASLLGK